MLAVARSDGLATCSACGALFAPRRRPNPNRRRFCPECSQLGIPHRLASHGPALVATSAALPFFGLRHLLSFRPHHLEPATGTAPVKPLARARA
jgi:hypothetical protein